ncbi:MAG TPA: DPP IV N-terminal domain-containing protein [Taishania sp.]|nr:DPP IV N-terminal domain-containing protein [Taishania sp.]
MNKIVCAFFLVIASFSFGQKELTLKDAVLQQYRSFYPERPVSFNWYSSRQEYSYLKDYTTLMKSSVKAKTDETLITIQDVNSIAGVKFAWFSGFEWLNPSEFLINNGQQYVRVNPAAKTATIFNELQENADNALLSSASLYVAYTIENNVYVSLGKGNAVQVTNFSDKNIVSGQAIARSEFGISGGLFWSPNGKILAFYQKDETDVHTYPLVNINETPAELMPIKYPMTGQKSEKPRVGIYNTISKNTVYITPRAASDDYLTNLTFTPDNNFVVIAEVNRDQNHMQLNVYDATTGAFVKTLLEEKNDKWVEPEHPAFFPSNKSNNFVWISEKDGFNNLYYYDFNGKLIKQLTANKFVAKEILTAKKDVIYFSATGENPLNTLIYSVTLKGKQKLLSQTEGTHEFALSLDGSLYYDGYSNHSTPFKAGIFSQSGKEVKHLLTASNPLADYKIGKTEIGSISAKDGSKLYTRLIKPSNFDASKKYPVLVYVYGGPHAQLITNSWYDGASLWMNWLAEQGYLVFTVDGRGSAERGFAFESQIHRQLGTVEIEDQLSGVDYLKSLNYVDGNRIAVHGWSFGGFMTTSLLLRHPGVFTCGVAGGPVTDWKYYEIMYGERYMDRPEQNEEGYKQASLLTHAANLKDDLLLIHGTVDDVVVMQHNFALVKKFVDLGIQMDFFPYPMHKHNVTGKDRVHLMTKVLNYVMEHNK